MEDPDEGNEKPDERCSFWVISIQIFLYLYLISWNNKVWQGIDAMHVYFIMGLLAGIITKKQNDLYTYFIFI